MPDNKDLEERLRDFRTKSDLEARLRMMTKLLFNPDLEDRLRKLKSTSLSIVENPNQKAVVKTSLILRRRKIYIVDKSGEKREVLDCSAQDLKDISHISLSPDGYRILFIASDKGEKRSNIYVVNKYGEDLREITSEGEGSEQNQGYFGWIDPIRFIYFASAHSKQTFDFFCKTETNHVHEVFLNKGNFPQRVNAFYLDSKNQLVRENFTEEEIEEAFSEFEKRLSGYATKLEESNTQLQKALRETKRIANKDIDKEVEKHDKLLDGMFTYMGQAQEQIKARQKIPAIENWIKATGESIRTIQWWLKEALPKKRKPVSIGRLRLADGVAQNYLVRNTSEYADSLLES